MPRGVYDRTKSNVVEGDVTIVELPVIAVPPDEVTAQKFLSRFLSGGPIIRHNVYRESENAGLNWEEVRKAFTELKGYEYFQKGEFFWRIAPE